MRISTLALTGFALAALAPTALHAQRGADLTARKAQKLAEPWLQRADWQLDFGAAKARAAETGRPIFVYFTRSYAP